MQPSTNIREIQWRAESAKKLLPRIEPLLPRIQATPPLDISFVDVLGIPIYITVRSADLHSMQFDRLKEWGELDFSYTHHGKGLTHEQSRVSCIMETLERYCASYHHLGDQSTVSAYDQLGKDALNPASYFLPPGITFAPDKPLMWYEGMDLIQNKTVLVPIDLAFINIPDSAFPFEGFQTKRLGFFFSNGLSAGSSIEEALMSGICEVVERDAQYRIINRIPPPLTELVIKDDPDFSPWLELFKKHDLSLRVFFLNHRPGFYTAFAAGWDQYCRLLALGSACAPQLRFALQQAILEVAQQRAFMFFKDCKTHWRYFPIIRYIRERIPPERYRTSVPASFWTEHCNGPIDLSEAGEDFPWDLESLVASLSEEHRVVGLDLTNPALGIPVVRVLISGLQNGYFDYQQALWFVDEG
jgi:ribosomal protein S12 methylthiotransferase accessory factor